MLTEVEEEWFRNLESRSKNIGFEFNIVSKEEAKKLNPFMNFDNARVIASTPNDGHVDPTAVVMPLSKLARKNGATVISATGNMVGLTQAYDDIAVLHDGVLRWHGSAKTAAGESNPRWGQLLSGSREGPRETSTFEAH